MLRPVPTFEESLAAVAKAVVARVDRRRRALGMPPLAAAGGIAEAIDVALFGDPGAPLGVVTARGAGPGVRGITTQTAQPGRDGWWRVGRVVDATAGAEFDVWYVPGARRVGIGSDRSG